MILGIDIGSLTTKAVLFDGKKVIGHKVIRTGSRSFTIAKEIRDLLLKENKLSMKDINYIVSTGYGRENVDFANKQVTEIICHAKGAGFLFPKTKTVIDVGGQDSKIIKVNDGKVVDFIMNDKCAAGTGRFLEVMSRALEVELEDMGKLSLKAKKAAPIASLCAVFAESEVVSHLSKGVKKEEILKGIHDSIVSRIRALGEQIKFEREVTLTGGVPKNVGFVKAVEDSLGFKINMPKEPQIVGALGAAVIGFEEYEKQ